jgi:hypothetical protein
MVDLWAGLRATDDVVWAGGGVNASAKLKNNLSLYADATAGYRKDAFSSGLAVEAIGGLRWRF